MIERITPAGVPVPRGPYSPGVRAGDFLFVAGQGPVDPATDKMSYGTIEEETKLVLANIERILVGCGSSKKDVVKCSVFLKHAEHFSRMNAVYAEFFGEDKPARTTVACAFADPQMLVEIDCIAYSPRK